MKDLENILSIFTGDILLKIDADGNILDTLLNTKKEIDTTKVKTIYQIFSPKEQERVKRCIDMNIQGKTKYMELNDKLGLKEEVSIETTAYNNELYMYIQCAEANREKEIEYERHLEGLINLSQKDPLTKTFNRNGLFEKVKGMVTTSDPDKRIGMIFVDIDNLKKINDTYGHDIGDKAIKSISNILCSAGRQRDIVARLGGDEFVLVVEEISGRRSTAYGLAKRLLKEFQKQEEKYSTTASLGVHIFKAKNLINKTKDIQKFEKALFIEIAQADEAVYKAKLAGRNQVGISKGYSKYYGRTLFSKASV